jgi:hypothetical protein
MFFVFLPKLIDLLGKQKKALQFSFTGSASLFEECP